MTQISRPFQIALLAMGLFAAVWFFALQGHSASTSGSGSSASAPSAPAQSAKAGSSSNSVSGSSSASEPAAAPSSVYHGAAPGVEGLTRAIARAHEAVATSRRNEKQLEEKSAQASTVTPSGTTGDSAPGSTATATGAVASQPVSTGSVKTHAVTVHAKVKPATTRPATTHKVASSGASTPSTASAKALPPMQATVEAELKQGKIVAVLFWNSKAPVDQAVQRELQAVGNTLGGKLAVHDARAGQVGSFGSITRDVQVFQTPTILIVNKHGQATSLTGLTDGFAIEQAIDEARSA
jgi:hypothetical protein